MCSISLEGLRSRRSTSGGNEGGILVARCRRAANAGVYLHENDAVTGSPMLPSGFWRMNFKPTESAVIVT
jgi:hypothetical protein